MARMTRAERKQLRKDQKETEKKLVAEKAIVPRYTPKCRFGRIMALILAFFFGMFITLGALVGAGVFVVTRPVKDAFSLVGVSKDTYSEFLSDTAAEKSIIDLVSEVAGLVGDYENLSIKKLEDYSPAVGGVLTLLAEQVGKVGINIDTATLANKPLNEVGSYFADSVLPSIEIGRVIGLDAKSNDLFLTLCFGEEGVDYDVDEDGKTIKMREGHEALSVGTLTGEGFSTDSLLEKITVEGVLEVNASSDPAMRYLAYGTQDVDYKIENNEIVMLEGENGELHKKKTISDLTNNSDAMIKGAKLSDLMDLSDATGIMATVKDWTIEKLSDSENIKDLHICDLIEIGEEETGILNAIRNWTIDDLGDSDKIKTLEIQDVVDLSGATGIMNTVKDWTIDELSNSDNIKKLHICDLIEIGEEETGILNAIRDWTIDDLGNSEKIEELKIGEIIDTTNKDGILKAVSDWSIAKLGDSKEIEKLKIGQIIDTTGKDGILKAVSDWTIAELGNSEKIKTLKISQLVGGGNDGVLGAIEGWTINDLSNTRRIERLKISQLIDVNSDSALLMQAIKDWRISDLTNQDMVNSLTLADILTINNDSARILQSLKTTPIGEFSDAIDNLRLLDILGNEDIEGNKLLKNLGNSTLKTLSEDIQKVSVADVFGNDLYSYMDKSAGSYLSLVQNYENGGYARKEDSNLVPTALDLNAGETIETYYVASRTETEVLHGVFEANGTGYTLLDKPDVHRTKNKTGDEEKYIERELTIVPVYSWSIVDYERGGTTPLPERCSVGTNIENYTDGSPADAAEEGSVAVMDGDARLYYLDASTSKYYALWEDDYSVYYLAKTETETVRTDLENSVASYKLNGETLTTPKAGKVTYEGKEYNVHTVHADGTQPEHYTITAHIPVKEFYYVEGSTQYTDENLHTEDKVTTKYRLKRSDDTTVEVDRFLEGAWYLLFGDEVWDDAHTKILSIKDDTTMSILEIAGNITKVSNRLNEAPLWKLFLHGVITGNPFVELELKFPVNGKTYSNLNELTIKGCIDYIEFVSAEIKKMTSWSN